MIEQSLRLSPDQVETLRALHPYAPDISWVPDVVHSDGWRVANVRYLEGERSRSAEAMRHLLETLAVSRVETPAQAADLIALAVEVFAPPSGFSGRIVRESSNTLRIENEHCPVYGAYEDSDWHSVTACPSWHRRRGWIDALGVHATDSVVGEKKWGDVACCSVIEIRSTASVA